MGRKGRAPPERGVAVRPADPCCQILPGRAAGHKRADIGRYENTGRRLTAGTSSAQHPRMRRIFTVEQANRMLPLVRKIAQDIVDQYARWRETVAACEVAAASGRGAGLGDAERLQREAQSLAAEIEGYIAELNGLGVESKGLEMGLVDFPGEIDGRAVYLCWRIGESEVTHWHEIDAGFAGRQPLASAAVTADRRS